MPKPGMVRPKKPLFQQGKVLPALFPVQRCSYTERSKEATRRAKASE